MNDKQERDPAGGLAGIFRSGWNRDWLFGLLLVAATLLAYLPGLHGKSVWDDDSWTTGIPRLLAGLSGLGTMWRSPTALQQYYPLTGTTFWLDHQFWGFSTLPYHVENVLLHSLAALLFWRLLRPLEVPGAWLAAAIFALHPLMVESAGWITERKNVLSLVLYLGALLAYGRFTRFWQTSQKPAPDPGGSSPGHWRAYALALLLFVAALLAKTTAFSLPAVLLLLGWWKRGRIRLREDALPSLPFFAVSINLGLVTAWLERTHVGAQGPEWAMTFPERCLVAGRALWFYADKLIWPANLCFVYPRWRLDAGSVAQWVYPLAAASVVLGLWLVRGRIGRGPLAAVLFFAGTLFPVLGFMNAYFMRYSFVCDHWTYLSSLGLIALGAALVTRVAERLRIPKLVYVFAVVLLPVLGGLTWEQSKMYQNIETLWRTTIARNPDCWMARNNLGSILVKKAQIGEAIRQLQETVRLKPDYVEAHYGLGIALGMKGQSDEAMSQYREAVRLRPDYAEAHYNLGIALGLKGQVDEAIGQFEEVIRLRPDYAEGHYNLGSALGMKGQADEAIRQYREALRLKPEHAETRNNLGAALLNQGQTDEAVSQFQETVRLKPDYAEAHYNLGNALGMKGQADEAIRQYREALRLKPEHAQAHNNLGAVLLSQGQIDEAIRQYQEAIRLKADYAEAHYNLGIALGSQGQADGAIIQFQEVIRLKPDDARAHDKLGEAFARRGQTGEAIGQYQEVIRLQPDNAEAYNNLGYLWAERGENLEQARVMLEKAVKLEPKNAAYLDSLGWVLFKLKRPGEALAYELRAVEDSGRPEAALYDHLGDIYAALDQRERAAEAWRKSLTVESNVEVEKKLSDLTAR